MAIEWGSFLTGSVVTIVVAVVAVLIAFSLLFGKVKEQIKWILTKLYSRLSLMLIAVFDVIAMFDPTQTLLGLGLGPIAGITVFLIEWSKLGDPRQSAERFKMKRLAPTLIEGFIAAVIISIPLPIAGLFVAWFGVLGDQKKQ